MLADLPPAHENLALICGFSSSLRSAGQPGLPAFLLETGRIRVISLDSERDGDVSGAFSRGDPDALALMYARFGPLLYSVALRALGTRSDAEDVTQQVFVSAWRSQHSFDPGRGTLGRWLVTITRNKVSDALRERQRDGRVLLPVAGGATVQAPTVNL